MGENRDADGPGKKPDPAEIADQQDDGAATDEGRRQMLDLMRKAAVKAAIAGPVVMTLKASPASAASGGSHVS